jgi:nucleoside-diphosphate-sugar epimerase
MFTNTIVPNQANGALGKPVLRQFLQTDYEVSILTREESAAEFPNGARVIRARYSDLESLKAAMQGQDVVISMVGPAQASQQQHFIDAAIAAGVQRFFPSEFGPYSRQELYSSLSPYVAQPKNAVVDYLRSKESQISWTAVICGGFFEWEMQDGMMGFDFATKTAELIDGGNGIATHTLLPVVAKALVAMLEHAGETENQYVFISSFSVSVREILDVVNIVDDHEWTIKHSKAEDVLAEGQRRVADGDFAGIKDVTRSVAFGDAAVVDLRPYGLWDARLGLPEITLEQAVGDMFGKGVR